jgi:ribonuclease HI
MNNRLPLHGISFTQINLQHSKLGTDSLCRTLGMLQTNICLIQEPWVNKGKIRGLGGRGNLYSFGSYAASPRACIITSRDIKAWPLLPYCSRDVTAIRTLWSTGIVVFASVYMAAEEDCPPPKVRDLVEYCSNNNLPLIIGSDCNAHHTLWGSSNINSRGVMLTEFLASSDLHVVNRGHKPTFVVSRRSEVIDVTFASSSILHRIQKWWVDDEESSSDHRYIKAIIQLGPPDPMFCRNRRRTDWCLYTAELRTELAKLNSVELTSVKEIEGRVTQVTSVMEDAIDNACPLTKVKSKGKRVPYWTKELSALRRAARRLYRHVRTGGDGAWNSYRSARNEYQSVLRREKTSSWRKYCEEIEDCPSASRLYRILQNDQFIKLSSIDKGGGDYTLSIEDSYKFLLQEHFPSDPNGEPMVSEHDRRTTGGISTIIVTPKLVSRAVRSFSPYKAAGADGIFPAMLQMGLQDLVPQLVHIMRACLEFGYTPMAWRKMRVVFTPKPGRDSYERASSWRPISLTSFLLKTLERLIDWYIRTPELIGRLKKANQFAYMAGVSTDAALHQVVARIEKTLKSGEYAIGVFLDIRGAFSDATFKSLINGLVRNDVCGVCTRFIRHMLVSRAVETSYMDEKFTREVERGCPQGGVLSPLLWNLVVDEVLRKLNASLPQVYSQGFADDLLSLPRGIDLGVVTEHAQRAINVVERWCRGVDLAVNEKLAIILFTNKRKFTPRPIKLGGVLLNYQKQVRYLGVTLDQKLSWVPHCKSRATKAMVALAQCRRAIGPAWGLKPSICSWIYTAVIRPVIEYASLVWVPTVKVSSKLRLLNRVQRTALVSVCGAMKSTPASALECLFGILPIGIRLQQVALQTMHRLLLRNQWLDWQGMGRTRRVTHIDLCERRRQGIPEMDYPCDNNKEFLNQEQLFKIKIRSMQDWMEKGFDAEEPSSWICYTDGSRMDGSSGAAIFVIHKEDEVGRSIPLGWAPTIYQAELRGLIEACDYMSHVCPVSSTISIYIDSRSALDSLASSKKVVSLVREVHDAVNRLGSGRNLKLSWIPAHKGYAGNEAADVLAKGAANEQFCGPQPSMAVSLSVVKLAIRDWARRCHVTEWRERTDCVQSKQFIGAPYSRGSLNCDMTSRRRLKLLVQQVTGHNTLNKHMSRMGLVDSPVCTLCGREEETSFHFLGVCERYCALRFDIFGDHTLSPEEIIKVPFNILTHFIVRSGRFAENERHDSAH